MDRREFLGWVGVGSVASCLPVALAACTPQNQQSQAPDSNEQSPIPDSSAQSEGFQTVGTVAELDQTGQLLDEEFAGGAVLVVRNPNDPQAIVAVNPTCTHAGCTVEWQADQQAFACPCHGSRFAADGTVLQGPASRPLSTYDAKLDGETVLVKS
ncbi:MAG: ubiquinol-cytochrome c reductase iron-sulfur subunit [Cyanobacteria bacterium CRU_2_1]|nr:ubiquinol-cytochrome c reductase iron-sulfur subunit [Cyanobacteria bacterium RU_5_0]NJR58461.1 ubiquinol-cytochrome c reductase iron-sulfur subunit [Cyanobacteria bacterium CRU_2_1]